MRVLTLNNQTFLQHCHQLEALARDYAPDLVVTIATGGDYVGANVFDQVPHISVHCQRASTKAKLKFGIFGKIIKLLPKRVNNVLRMAEAKCLSIAKISKRRLLLTAKQIDVLGNAEKILIVDDAVDSGATLSAVIEAIAKLPGKRNVRTAVITVTASDPAVMPDFFIYNNHTLIRFPWSADAN
jgi:predicted amidophosphoribosyltransferase